ncbi:unnamed protein product [Musa acuminata subsp. malaccensis]|uniref:(wild Malaysian banana) hypothetical protein n=1 Tax=Musa acuminata subsp. malaccensis TaxID=214687 RepID=A0A804K029_MUSAM|nr:unnamed protein product [Musa acuminata subsp. malaccensis]
MHNGLLELIFNGIAMFRYQGGLLLQTINHESHSRFRAAHEAALQVDGIPQAWAAAFLYKDEDEQR